MNFEVELKYQILDKAAWELSLQPWNLSWGPDCEQIDTYLAHPSRDFAKTDEALRIRVDGDRQVVTYKGPKLDAETKTREEIELPIAEDRDDKTRQEWITLFERLGFQVVASVHKIRRSSSIDFHDRQITIVWDRVTDVGEFTELELISSPATLDADRELVLQLANELGLKETIRTSYLELLLDSQQ